MSSPFVSVTKVALDEIVKKHTEASKFGFFMTEAQLNNLVEELVLFLETSRSLKAAGDRLLYDQVDPKNGRKSGAKVERPISR